VIEVLKHLPYIRTDHDRAWRLGYQDTLPIAYVDVEGPWDGAGFRLAHADLKEDEGKVDQEFLWKYDFEPYGEKLGENVVALTNGMQYGAWLLLDVEAGELSSLLFTHLILPCPIPSFLTSHAYFPSSDPTISLAN